MRPRLGRCRGCTVVGVSADTNPEIAETLVHSAEARRERLIWCAGSKAVMTRARLSMSCCFRGGDRGAQCSASADRGHSATIQWPVIPAVPCLSWYGADATSRPIGHSAVSSRHPAEIAGVVDALMGHDVLSRRSVEAGGDGLWTSQPRAIRRIRPRARRRLGSLSRSEERRVGKECSS